jgi:hypothetical protein
MSRGFPYIPSLESRDRWARFTVNDHEVGREARICAEEAGKCWYIEKRRHAMMM